jgi:hypothetical protein
MEEVGFVLTGIAWTGGNRSWPNWLIMGKVSFGLTGTAWNGGSRFWPV